MSVVIAERELGCSGGGAQVRLYTPQQDQQDWRCEYEITWPNAPRRSYALGADSFQALQLAMFKIAVDLEFSDEFKAGRLTVFDESVTTIAELKQLFPASSGFNP